MSRCLTAVFKQWVCQLWIYLSELTPSICITTICCKASNLFIVPSTVQCFVSHCFSAQVHIYSKKPTSSDFYMFTFQIMQFLESIISNFIYRLQWRWSSVDFSRKTKSHHTSLLKIWEILWWRRANRHSESSELLWYWPSTSNLTVCLWWSVNAERKPLFIFLWRLWEFELGDFGDKEAKPLLKLVRLENSQDL